MPYQFLTSGKYTVWHIITEGNRAIVAVFSNTAALGNVMPTGLNQTGEGNDFRIGAYRLDGTIGALNMQWFTGDGAGGPAPGDTALPGVDYTAASGTTGFANGEIGYGGFGAGTPIIGPVPILQTNKTWVSPQAREFFTFTIRITTPGAYFDPTAYPSHTTELVFPVYIIRDGPGTLNFVGTPYSITRPGGSTTVTLQVQRFTGFKGAVGCSFHSTNGTALSGVAYTAQSSTLSWADKEGGTKNIVMTILNGGSGTQSFTVTIDTPTGGTSIGSIPTATVDIVASAPPANPTAGGSIPQQLSDTLLPEGSGDLRFSTHLVLEPHVGQWANHITFNGMLANKIGNFIGFAPGTESFGGGTDFVDYSPYNSLNANRSRIRRANYKRS